MTREEAIQQLQNCKDLIKQDGQDYLDERDVPILDMAIEALSGRPIGEWIDADGNKVRLDADGNPLESCWCSNCGEWLVASDKYMIKAKFCPCCGAKMGEKSQ